MSNNSNHELIIKTKVWVYQKNLGNNLIDYNQEGQVKEKFRVNSSGNLFFSSSEIRFSKNIQKNKDKILIIEKNEKNDKYYLDCEEYQKNLDLSSAKFGAFLPYRSKFFKNDNNSRNKKYKLDKCDIIKLGKVFIRIIDIKLEKEITSNFQNYNNSLMNQNKRNSKNDLLDTNKIQVLPRINSARELPKILIKTQKNKICRICYDDSSNMKNPLINPCKCKGTMKYIHYNCLLNWMKNKIEKPNDKYNINQYISYDKSLLNCELCKSSFPYYVKYKNNFYNIFPYISQFKEYLLFEMLDKTGKKTINIISLEKKDKINIGRISSNDICIEENSLSRSHSIIHKDKLRAELYIEDNNSKFGTLILIQNNKIEINDFYPLRLQINSVYIKIKKILNKTFSCCNVDTTIKYIEEKLEYQNQNKNSEIKNSNEIKDLDKDSENNKYNNESFENKEKEDLNQNNDNNDKLNYINFKKEIKKDGELININKISIKREIKNKNENIISLFNSNFDNIIKNKEKNNEINKNIKNKKRAKSINLYLDIEKLKNISQMKTIKNKRENKIPFLTNLEEHRCKEESLLRLYFPQNKNYLNHSRNKIKTLTCRNFFIKN